MRRLRGALRGRYNSAFVHRPASEPSMQDKYLPAAIERAAQQHWNRTGAARAVEDAGKPKY